MKWYEKKINKRGIASKEIDYPKVRKFLIDTDYIDNKYVDLVVRKKEMTESEFLDKYQDRLDKRDEARTLL